MGIFRRKNWVSSALRGSGMSGSNVCFINCGGLYLSVDNKNNLVARDRRVTSKKAVFTVLMYGNGMHVIQGADTSMYVSAEKGGGAKAVANKTSIDSWEEVCVTTVSDQPGKVNIVGSKGNYLSVGP